jgi:hypothetical protein
MNATEITASLAAIYAKSAAASHVNRVPDMAALPNCCHENARRHCKANPGASVVTGWLISPFFGAPVVWLYPHSIVRCADGQLLDVTPQNDERPRLKFVPDTSLVLLEAIARNQGYYDFMRTDDGWMSERVVDV